MGRSGLKLSAISLGSWNTFCDQIGEEVAIKLIRRAYEAGIFYFDNGLPKEKTRLTRAPEWVEKVITQECVDAARRLTALANETGATTAQLAIAWLLRIPEGSSVLTGATQLDHLDDNLKALEFEEMLTPDILDKIKVILDNFPNETESV